MFAYPRVAFVGLCMIAAILATLAVPASADETDLSATDPTGTQTDDVDKSSIEYPSDERMAAWSSCQFSARADRPHVSSNGVDASGHGTWTTNNADDCPDTVKVKVELQALLCKTLFGIPYDCRFRTVASRTRSVTEGHQVTVHKPCNTFEEASWRTKVTASIHRRFWFDITRTDEKEDEINCRL